MTRKSAWTSSISPVLRHWAAAKLDAIFSTTTRKLFRMWFRRRPLARVHVSMGWMLEATSEYLCNLKMFKFLSFFLFCESVPELHAGPSTSLYPHNPFDRLNDDRIPNYRPTKRGPRRKKKTGKVSAVVVLHLEWINSMFRPISSSPAKLQKLSISNPEHHNQFSFNSNFKVSSAIFPTIVSHELHFSFFSNLDLNFYFFMF